MKHNYTYDEIVDEMNLLRNTFDIVRLVEPFKQNRCTLFLERNNLKNNVHKCYSTWRKEARCANCISAKAILDKTRYTKFEFIDNKAYHVVSKYVCVDGEDLALELVTDVSENIMLKSNGYNEFVERINYFNNGIYIDELTGIYNRKYLNEKLSIMLKEMTHNYNRFAVVIADINGFKKINDTYGHITGDKILKKVTDVLKSNIRKETGDFIARFGGDEFIIVFNNIGNADINKILKRITTKINNVNLKDSLGTTEDISVSLSVGVVISDEIENPTIDTIIESADKRLYISKKNQQI